MEDLFFEARTISEATYAADSASVSCRIDERWKTLHVMTSACGGSVEYTVTKRCGLTQTDSETLTASFGSTIGVPKLAELKSAVESKLGTAVTWDTGFELQETHTVTAPPCGRRTDTVYQLLRDYHFVLLRRGWFGRVQKRAWSVSEAMSLRHVEPEIEPWIPECHCPKKAEAPPFDIIPAVLRIGSVTLGTEVWRSGAEVRLNLGGRLAALDAMPNQPVKLNIPRSMLMPMVLWLADSVVDDPLPTVLFPNRSRLGRHAETPFLEMGGQLQTLVLRMLEGAESGAEATPEYDRF